MKPKPRNIKYHICPRCREQAIVLVDTEDDDLFYLDNNGNVQYQCINIRCLTTFSVDAAGDVISIKLNR